MTDYGLHRSLCLGSFARGPVPVRTAPWVVVSVDGILNNLLDLTDAATLAALGTTAQEMTGTWAATPLPPTQLLGQLAYDSGRIAGIRYASAKRPGGLNLVVFSDRIPIAAANFLECTTRTATSLSASAHDSNGSEHCKPAPDTCRWQA